MSMLLRNIYLASGLAFAAGLHAEWQVIDDFSSGTLSSEWTVEQNREQGDASLTVISEPGSTENNVLRVHPGTSIENTLNLIAYRPIPDIPGFDSTPKTVYLRVQVPSVNGSKGQVDTVWGLTPVGAPVNNFNDFSALMRVEYDESFDVYEGDLKPGDTSKVAYVSIREDDVGITADAWYEIWMVLNTDVGGYKVFVAGPEFPKGNDGMPMQVYPNADMGYEFNDPNGDGWASFRTDPGFDPLNHFRIMTSAGNTAEVIKGIDPTYIDDIYIDLAGQNLTSPAGGGDMGPGIFASYSLDASGNVSTGAWMGDVYVTEYPWIYIWDAESWAHVAEGGADADGAWVYIVR